MKIKIIQYQQLQIVLDEAELLNISALCESSRQDQSTFWVKSMSVNTLPFIGYSLDIIQDEARQLVQKGVLSRQQPIYTLCQYIPAREWVCIECELEKSDFLLRDRIGDLIGREEWDND